MKTAAWIQAFRLRTLPLSLSCIGMGGFLAAAFHQFSGMIFGMCCLTTLFLQILSNLANDLGDSIHGADHGARQGPSRAVQSGAISSGEMKLAVVLFSLLSLISGLTLLWISFGADWHALLFFIFLGLLSIGAAIGYTMGKKPYGYAGLGDLSVLIFFGLVGVMGSLYLFTHQVSWTAIFPAIACGLFSIAVLNINNIRDIDSDRAAGKYSLPVRLGRDRAIAYHWMLLGTGILCALTYSVIHFQSYWQFLFVASIPLFIANGRAVAKKPSAELDPYLKQMALSTLLFVILFGVGSLLN